MRSNPYHTSRENSALWVGSFLELQKKSHTYIISWDLSLIAESRSKVTTRPFNRWPIRGHLPVVVLLMVLVVVVVAQCSCPASLPICITLAPAQSHLGLEKLQQERQHDRAFSWC